MYSEYPKTSKPKKKEGPEDNVSRRPKKKEKIKTDIPLKKKSKEEVGFEKAKTKIKITLFKNGYILDDGPFKDKSIPENKLFLEQIEKSVIPKELLKKGNNLGIILENRKNEEYLTTPIIPAATNANTFIQGNVNINTTNINQNIYTNNIYPNINLNPVPNTQNNTIKIVPPVEPKPEPNINEIINIQEETNFNYQSPPNIKIISHPEDIFTNLNINEYTSSINIEPRNEFNMDFRTKDQRNQGFRTPIGTRGTRREIFLDKDVLSENRDKPRKSVYRKRSSKFKTFESFIKQVREKEDEELMKKGFKKVENIGGANQSQKKEEKEEEKKFVAFEGSGYFIGNVNIEGLKVNKDFKNKVDKSLPTCNFNIRLFDGEIIKSEFNLNQTLKDIYVYVSQLSGSTNFMLLEGFPPKPLKQLNQKIKDLKLDNTTLTQKIH